MDKSVNLTTVCESVNLGSNLQNLLFTIFPILTKLAIRIQDILHAEYCKEGMLSRKIWMQHLQQFHAINPKSMQLIEWLPTGFKVGINYQLPTKNLNSFKSNLISIKPNFSLLLIAMQGNFLINTTIQHGHNRINFY